MLVRTFVDAGCWTSCLEEFDGRARRWASENGISTRLRVTKAASESLSTEAIRHHLNELGTGLYKEARIALRQLLEERGQQTEGTPAMTEAEWLACTEPLPMVEYLRGRASERKLRLFAVACCRSTWNLLRKSSKKAVEAAERYADGLATDDDMRTVHASAWAARNAAWKTYLAARNTPPEVRELASAGAKAASDAARVALCPPANYWDSPKIWSSPWSEDEFLKQCALLHCIFGLHPFRNVPVNSSWLTSTVVALAVAIYDERAFDRLPVLGDALEDVGCTDQEILAHCRGPGPHVRGCWVADLLLRKE